MIYTDTRDKDVKVDFKTAVMNGMNPMTGGLYMPTSFPHLDKSFLTRNPEPSFRETAFVMAKAYIEDEIPESDLEAIIEDCYPFTAKVVPVDPITYILELFHGPTCAFKDFGARFMARTMSYFNRNEKSDLHILVATSGDTGSAVGSAFQGVKGIDVTILYPEGKISHLQEKQLSTFTGNVRALRVKGNFDDCQKLVKTAFTDKNLRKKLRLSSANSINIARLLPQSFYYMHSSIAVKKRIPFDSGLSNASIIVVVPSGNFGNLTSGLIAREMGAPIDGFVAATNSNHTFPDWLATGRYTPRTSIPTLSNAMDVGSPSNYERIKAMYSHAKVKKFFSAYWTDDDGTLKGIKECKDKTGYVIDPHGAVAWKAWSEIRDGGMERLLKGETFDYKKPGLIQNIPEWADKITEKNVAAIVLETAHPAKFSETVKEATGREPVIPDRLEKVLSLPDNSIAMENDFETFKAWLLKNL